MVSVHVVTKTNEIFCLSETDRWYKYYYCVAGVPFPESTGQQQQQEVGSLYDQYDNNDDEDSQSSDDDNDDDDDSDGEEEEEDNNNEDENDANNYDRNQLLDLGDDDDNVNDDEGDNDTEIENTRSQPMSKTRGISPLFLAIKENHKDCIKVLLKSGCSLEVLAEAEDGQFVGPFEYALVGGFISTAKMLLTCGITRNNMNPTLLTMAFDLLLTMDDEHGIDGSSRGTPGKDGTTSSGMELVDWFIDQIKVPPSLMTLSRKTIRNAMGRKVIGAIPELHLPNRLEDYVSLCDLDEY